MVVNLGEPQVQIFKINIELRLVIVVEHVHAGQVVNCFFDDGVFRVTKQKFVKLNDWLFVF